MGLGRSLWFLFTTSISTSIADFNWVNGRYKVIVKDGCALLDGIRTCSPNAFGGHLKLYQRDDEITDFILVDVNKVDVAVGFPHQGSPVHPECAQQLSFPSYLETVYLSALTKKLYSNWGILGGRSVISNYVILDSYFREVECWQSVPAGIVCENPYVIDREPSSDTQVFNTDSSTVRVSNVNQQPQEEPGDANLATALLSNAIVPQELAANPPPSLDESDSYQNTILERGIYEDLGYDYPGCFDSFSKPKKTGGTGGRGT